MVFVPVLGRPNFFVSSIDGQKVKFIFYHSRKRAMGGRVESKRKENSRVKTKSLESFVLLLV